jgi:transcriptional regulator
VCGVVGRRIRKHESTEPKPCKMGYRAPSYIVGMLKANVGTEVAITGLEGESKPSQNRDVRDRLNSAAFLQNRVKLN